jgi:phage replication O-like protein O
MASPQVENGYAPIANELLDAILRFGFTGTQTLIVLWVIRHTFGWSRKTVDFSWHRIAKEIGMDHGGIVRQGNALVSARVLFSAKGKIGIQKNHELWRRPKKAVKKAPARGPQADSSQSSPVENEEPETSICDPKVETVAPKPALTRVSLDTDSSESRDENTDRNQPAGTDQSHLLTRVSPGTDSSQSEGDQADQNQCGDADRNQSPSRLTGVSQNTDQSQSHYKGVNQVKATVLLRSTGESFSKTPSKTDSKNDVSDPKPETPLQQVMNHYIEAKGTVLDKAQTSAFYERFGKAAKALLEVCEMNPGKAKKKIDEIGSHLKKNGLGWTLDTIHKWTCDPSLMQEGNGKNGKHRDAGEAAPKPGKYGKFSNVQ